MTMNDGMFPDSPVPIAAQVTCVEREIGLREKVYPRWVAAGRLSQTKADQELELMRAVLATLRAIETVERP